MIVPLTINTMSELFLDISRGTIKASQIKKLPPTEDEILLRTYQQDSENIYLVNLETVSLPVKIMISNFYGCAFNLN